MNFGKEAEDYALKSLINYRIYFEQNPDEYTEEEKSSILELMEDFVRTCGNQAEDAEAILNYINEGGSQRVPKKRKRGVDEMGLFKKNTRANNHKRDSISMPISNKSNRS